MHLADLTNTQFFFLTLISLGVCYAVATAIALVNDSGSADSGHQRSFLEPAAPDAALQHRDDGGSVVATVNFAQRQSQRPVASNVGRPSRTQRAVEGDKLSTDALLRERCARAALDAARQALLDPVSSDR